MYIPPAPAACTWHFLSGSLLDLVSKAEVIVQGLYHADASDLEISLLHQEHSCSLVVPRTKSAPGGAGGATFGVPVDRRYMQGFGPDPGEWFHAIDLD